MDGKRDQRRLPKLLRQAVPESIEIRQKLKRQKFQYSQGFTQSEALIGFYEIRLCVKRHNGKVLPKKSCNIWKLGYLCIKN